MRYTESQFISAVANNQSIRSVLKELGLQPTGGNYKSLHMKVRLLGLDTSHWTGMGHLKGKKNTWAKKQPLENILVVNSTYRGGSHKLKKRLLKEGYLQAICDRCKGTEWLSHPMPLELEHINGDNCDNRRENLILLCPNCHTLTPTYRGKNKGRMAKLADAQDKR